MNDRMTELYAAACLYAREKHLEDRDVQAFVEDMAKRFSELIVRECAERLMQDDFGSVKGVMSIAGARLKEHFGVEQ